MATAVWQPQEDGLKEICGLLEQYRLPTVDQSRIWQQHQRCSQLPDFNNYLAFILCRAEVCLDHVWFEAIILGLVVMRATQAEYNFKGYGYGGNQI